MTTPTIPPRPSRSQNKSPSAGSSNMEVPRIPPRPAKRSVDRSVSPHRDTFARSPFNDPAYLHSQATDRGSRLSVELPARPPSVTLPELGQEGLEYASLEDLSRSLSKDEPSAPPQQTKNIAGDLPLHAPKASVPSSTAKSRIQTVTRTDSSQAAAAGIGKLAPDESGTDTARSGSSTGNRSRPGSVYRDNQEEQGIPEIGVQVPMYPNAGDVQAPTPSPYDQPGSSGIGFFNKGGLPTGRHHGRTKSGREIFYGPPGSYGLHGHGVIPKDEFEQQWYAKHPEDLKREQQGEYGRHIRQDRKEYHWVTDDLDKLVHSSAATGAGMGTSREAIGTPDEQIGYLASEEFASRIASPKPPSGRPGSILRHEAQPQEKATEEKATEEKAGDEEDTGVIHIDPPSHPGSRVHGGGYDPPTEDLGPHGGNTDEEGGLITERGYGVPILASDEVQKNPEVVWRQPAVSPELERRTSGEFSLNEPDGRHYVTKQRTHSRSSSRGTGNKLTRIASPTEQYDRSGTPLEPMIEYEPLFPEDDEAAKKPKSAVDKVKRPEIARHQFPSQDVWEDTPSSLQLETTVETPQVPEEPYEEQTDKDAGTVFEDLKSEEHRREQEPPEEQKSFLPDYTKRFANKHLNKEYLGGGRPNMQQRFPSHDVWEDAPDYGQLVTTVSTPQTDDSNEYADSSPVVEKASPFTAAKPGVPTDKKPAPIVPERPKPSVPARPSKPLTKSSDKVPTLDSQAAAAAAEPEPAQAQAKPKPTVPARPAGSKIAALQAGFLKDLNNKLGLGPQAPKPKEPEPAAEEEEQEAAKPLADARKGRAKGPQRRRPARSPSTAAAAEGAAKKAGEIRLDTSSVSTVWTIEEDGRVDVPAARMAERIQAALKGEGKGKAEVEQEEEEEGEKGEKEGLLASATKAVADTVKAAVSGTASSSDDQAQVNTPESDDAEPKAQEGEQGGDKEGVSAEQVAAATQGPTPGETKRAVGGVVPTGEPVDAAVVEEGKGAEARDVGV